ncbi:hypothetical protein NYA28ABAC_00929 [Salinicola sp. NYA28a]
MALNANEVKALYVAYLGRAADQEGLTYWTEQVPDDFTLADLRYNLVNFQPEYQDLYGGLDREGVVTEIYQNMFGREPDAEGLAYWTTGGGSSLSIDKLQQQFIVSASAEDRAAFEERVDELGVGGETLSLTADADDRLFGTANNDTFNAEAGTLQTGDQLLDQSTTDNDTLNAVISNANKNPAPTLLNVENVNLDLDVFSGAAFDAVTTEGATITASSSKLGFNGQFTLDNAGDNNVVAGENVTNLTVQALEAGSVDTGAAEEASVTTVGGSDGEVANITVNGDIELGVDTAETLNLTATADAVVDLSNVARGAATDASEVVGSGEGAITLRGDMTGVTDITGVDTVVVTSDAAVASEWEVNSISIAADINSITVADAANVTIDEEQEAVLTISGQGNTGSSVNVSSNLAALGSVAFADSTLASAELELTAAGVEVASLDANDAALTVNVTDGAEFAALVGESIELVGAGDVTLTDANAVSVLDASGLDGALEITTNATGDSGAASTGIEISGAVGNNTLDVTGNDDLTFVGQAGDDAVNLVANSSEVSLVLGAGDDTVTLEGALTGTAAISFGDGNDTLELADGVSTVSTTGDVTITGLENVVLGGATATMEASQLDGQEYSIRGEGFGASELTVSLEDGGDSVDLSGLDVSDSASAGAAFAITGGDGDDTITGTGLADTITGGAGADTLTGGAGADTFAFGINAAASTDSTAAATDSITDFVGGTDEIQFTNATVFEVVADQTITDAADLGAAVTAAFAASANASDTTIDALQFTYDSKTYFAVEGGAAANETDALVIDVTGVSGTVTADDFVAA